MQGCFNIHWITMTGAEPEPEAEPLYRHCTLYTCSVILHGVRSREHTCLTLWHILT